LENTHAKEDKKKIRDNYKNTYVKLPATRTASKWVKYEDLQ